MTDPAARLRPYVAGLAVDLLQSAPRSRHRRIEGSLAFVDISGFTTLTERLAAQGKAGAEEMSDLLDGTFATLLEVGYAYGASLVKWGGDAVLLLFEGPEHPLLAARAAHDMQATMRRIGRLRTSVGIVQLRMSVGIHSGAFDFFVGGRRHRELVVAGLAATTTALMEQTAEAGEVVVSAATAAQLPPPCVGAAKGDGSLLAAGPEVAPRSRAWAGTADVDAGPCLDPAIRDHLLTEVGDSEHRQVAVGFVEISGVDDLIAQQGPGSASAALHDLLSLVQDQCEHHRVTFWETDISTDGFKVMLVAGAPRSTGHDDEGLLRATRGVLDGHRGLLRVRIGVNSGRVFTGAFGPPFRRTWSVKGDAVNLAARVMGRAASGQLVATQALLDRVSAPTESQPLEAFLVKGKAQPVHAAAVSAVAATRAPEQWGGATFVGRDREVTTLRLRLAGTAGRRGAAVLVHGEPGAGKSRLVEHALEGRDPLPVLRCFADAYESATPHFVVGRLLRAALDVSDDLDDHAVVAALEQRARTSRPELLDHLPLLASALGVERPQTPQSAAVQGKFRGARIASLTVDLLTVLLPHPVVIVVDDVHCADAASAEVLAALALATSDRGWLLLLVGRGAPDALGTCPAVERLEVGPLSTEDGRRLVLSSGGQGLPHHVLRALVARAEGNPLFLVELTAAVTAGDAELPSTLEELLVARIDDLAPAQRQVMRVASVLGTHLDQDLLAELLGAPVEPAVWDSLERFVTAESSGSRRFRSGLVRDAAYEGLPFRRRIELHGRAADALQRRGDDDVAGALSLHSLAARRYDQAWRWSVLAGRQAQQAHANAEALVFLGRARTAARRLPRLDPLEHSEVLEAVGDVHARLADLEPAVLAYREARRRAPRESRLLRARIALSTALVAERSGAPARASRWLTTAWQDVQPGPGEQLTAALAELACRITVERAFIQHTVGKEARAAQLARQAMEQAEQVGAVDVVGRALLLLEWVELWTGGAGDERRVLRALALFEECGDLPRQGGAWNQLGMSAYFRGDWDLAVDRYRKAQQVHERSADEWSAAIANANIAEILIDQGRLEEAEPLVTESLRVWRASGTPSDIGFGSALLGRLCSRQGRSAEAMALLSEAAASFAVNHERIELVDVELRLAEALLLQGATEVAAARLDEAERRLRDAVRVRGVVGEDGVARAPHAVPLLRLRGCLAVQNGDLEQAAELLTRCVDLARASGSAHELGLSLRALAWAEGTTSAEGEQVLERLGVRWAPDLRRPLPLPEQRAPNRTRV